MTIVAVEKRNGAEDKPKNALYQGATSVVPFPAPPERASAPVHSGCNTFVTSHMI